MSPDHGSSRSTLVAWPAFDGDADGAGEADADGDTDADCDCDADGAGAGDAPGVHAERAAIRTAIAAHILVNCEYLGRMRIGTPGSRLIRLLWTPDRPLASLRRLLFSAARLQEP